MLNKLSITIGIICIIKNWPKYFLNYLCFVHKKNVLYNLRNGIVYKIRSDTPDFGTLLEIWLEKIYTPKNMFISKTDFVVDIGAHIGTFSVFASTFAHDGTVYALEPLPENFEILKENIKLNSIKNIIPTNIAITGKKEKRTLAIINTSPGVGTLLNQANAEKKITVSAMSLNDFMRINNISKIDFLKIDCEGSEYEILFSCNYNTLKRINKISMEYHYVDEARNAVYLQNFLEKMGFIVKINTFYRTLYAIRQ